MKLSEKEKKILRTMRAPFDSDYPLSLTESVILNILKSEKEEPAVRSDLDVYVRNVELEWAKANIVKALFYDPSRPDFKDGFYRPLSRPEILRYMKKVVHIGRIRDWLVQVVEKYVEKEKEWLQALEDFKRAVKLARLNTDKTEQALKFPSVIIVRAPSLSSIRAP